MEVSQATDNISLKCPAPIHNSPADVEMFVGFMLKIAE